MRLRRKRAPNVDRLVRNRDLQGLCEAAVYEDRLLGDDGTVRDAGTEIRVRSLDALSSFFGPPVTRAMTRGLEDPFRSVRLAAVRAVASARLVEVEPALLTGLALWEDPPHGEAIAEAESALEALVRDERPERFAGVLIEREDAPLDERRHALLMRLLDADSRGPDASSATAALLLAVVADPAASVAKRSRAREVFGWIRGHGIEPLLHLLALPEPDLLLIELAGEVGDNRALPLLIPEVDSPAADRRVAVATALGALLDTRAVPALLRLTQDESQDVRRAATYSLNGFGAAGVVFSVAATTAELEGTTARAQPRALTGSSSDRSSGAVTGEVVGREGEGASARLFSAMTARGPASVPSVESYTDEQLAETYALAIAQREGSGEDTEYWNRCVDSVLAEASRRPEFGSDLGTETRGRERRRLKQAANAIRGQLAERA